MTKELMPALKIITDNELKGRMTWQQKNAPGHVSSSPGLRDGVSQNKEAN